MQGKRVIEDLPLSFVVITREHVDTQSTQGKLVRKHVDTQDTLTREHARHVGT